jgi:hypothetical protein
MVPPQRFLLDIEPLSENATVARTLKREGAKDWWN